MFVEIYESTPFPKLKLLARALEHATELAGGRIVVSELRREDFEAAGRRSPTRRASSTTSAPSTAPSSSRSSASCRKVLCSAARGRCALIPNGVDVSAIARDFGGGGHRRAAGFSTDLAMDEITRRIVGAFAAADGARET